MLRLQDRGDDDRGRRVRPGEAAETYLGGQLREGPHLVRLGLGVAAPVGDPEVHLERVMRVRRLADQVVVVGVVPGQPPGRAGQQGVVQDLAVVGGRVSAADVVAGHPELLDHDRLPADVEQFADVRGREVLPDRIGLHPVDVRAVEVDERGQVAHPEAVVAATDLESPHAVADRHRLGAAAGPDRVDQDLRPGGDHRRVVLAVPAGPLVRVDGNLVAQQPCLDRRVAGEPGGELADVPGLPGDHPHVPVEVAAGPPRRVPVLPGHVADQERRDRRQAQFGVHVEELPVAVDHLLVDRVGGRHEVGPVEEAARQRHAEVAHGGQFGADHRRVEPRPHAWPARPRPEVDADPGDGSPVAGQMGRLPLHGGVLSRGGLKRFRDGPVARSCRAAAGPRADPRCPRPGRRSR